MKAIVVGQPLSLRLPRPQKPAEPTVKAAALSSTSQNRRDINPTQIQAVGRTQGPNPIKHASRAAKRTLLATAALLTLGWVSTLIWIVVKVVT
jgi:hypothetical protein